METQCRVQGLVLMLWFSLQVIVLSGKLKMDVSSLLASRDG